MIHFNLKTSTMKTNHQQNLLVVALVGVLVFPSAYAQQVPIPTTAEVSGPVPGNVMTKEYVQMVGCMAYVRGCPMVSAHSRRGVRQGARAAGVGPKANSNPRASLLA